MADTATTNKEILIIIKSNIYFYANRLFKVNIIFKKSSY